MKIVEPLVGDTREKTFYAWWPVTLGHETRWLEYVTVAQVYTYCGCWWGKEWRSAAFLDGDT